MKSIILLPFGIQTLLTNVIPRLGKELLPSKRNLLNEHFSPGKTYEKEQKLKLPFKLSFSYT